MGELRDSKKRKTRQRISDVATMLFFARGFEAVTVDEIAHAAKVSKMTVFNYFARKEELLLDREDDLLLLPFREAVRARPKGQSPIDALRALVPKLAEARSPLAHFDRGVVQWWSVVAASPSLEARIRELADEAAEGLANELAGPSPDGRARLMAAFVVHTQRTAREESIRLIARGVSLKKANAAFLELMEHGLSAAAALGALGR